ncbi:hypothetical protein LguiA_030022 [Lonicera macranthoides]
MEQSVNEEIQKKLPLEKFTIHNKLFLRSMKSRMPSLRGKLTLTMCILGSGSDNNSLHLHLWKLWLQ